MEYQVTYYWDFEFQGQFAVSIPEDKRPYLAIAGGILHGDIYGELGKLLCKQGALELRKKSDFRNRDRGFTKNRAIRGDDLKVVRVMDQKKRKPMMAMPDIVDYRNDTIIDLKTHYLRKPPDEGGIFVTVDDVPGSVPSGEESPQDVEIPHGYEDAWTDLKRLIKRELGKKYESQFNRYHKAYLQATGRNPAINIYVVLYTNTGTCEEEVNEGGIKKLSK